LDRRGKAELVIVDFLAGSVGGLDHQPPLFPYKTHWLVPDLAHKKDGFSGGFTQGQVQLVFGHLVLQGLADLVFDPQEAVGGDHAADALMGPGVVDVVDEVGEAEAAVLEFLGLDAVPKLGADGFPEAFAFAQGLGVVGPGHHVADAFALEDLLELGLAAPGKILAALVGKHLQGLAEALDTVEQGLDDQPGFLLEGDFPADDVPGKVIQEHGEVHPLAVPGQDEAGDVGLPELIGLGTLEETGFPAPLAPLFPGGRGVQIGLLEDPPDRSRADLEAAEAVQGVPDPLEAVLRVVLLDLADFLAQGLGHTPLPPTEVPVLQSLGALGLVPLDPQG
jgi:hypothetical protein